MIRDLIYDVGMNNGDDTAYYLHRGFRVLAIEADPDLCAQAERRFDDATRQGRLTVLNIGIAERAGTLDFWICETHSAWNSFDQQIASRDGSPYHSVPVSCQPFRSVLDQYGVPYYLKVDIEGNDHLCLLGLSRTDLPRYLSFELTDLALLEQLEGLGYCQFKCISQYYFLPLQCPPAPEVDWYEHWYRLLTSRRKVARGLCTVLGWDRIQACMHRRQRVNGWVFPEGSSGPFGEDTLGRWLDAGELRNAFCHYSDLFARRERLPYWMDQGYSFWVDLHARLPT